MLALWLRIAGVESICDVTAPLSLRTGSLPGARGQRSPGALRDHPDGSHGIVAATDWPGWSLADHGVILQ